MAFGKSAEEKSARRAVANSVVKRRKNRLGDIREIAEELDSKYDIVIEARHTFRRALEVLENLETETEIAQALGQKPPDLTKSREEVDRTRIIWEARQKQVELIEKRAKRKYPDIFRFL